jgi:hypothetical protein
MDEIELLFIVPFAVIIVYFKPSVRRDERGLNRTDVNPFDIGFRMEVCKIYRPYSLFIAIFESACELKNDLKSRS